MRKLILIKTILAICVIALCSAITVQSLVEKDYFWGCVYVLVIVMQLYIIITDIHNEIDNL